LPSQAADFLELFAAQAELAGAAAGIGDSQNRKWMSAAAGADRAAAAVAYHPLHLRTTQDLSGHRELADQRLPRRYELISRHSNK
jgi:hypothetical protein